MPGWNAVRAQKQRESALMSSDSQALAACIEELHAAYLSVRAEKEALEEAGRMKDRLLEAAAAGATAATAAAAAAAKTAAIDEMAAVIAAMRLEPPTAGVDQMEQSALFESPSAPDTDSDDSDDGDDSDDSDVAKRLQLDDLV